MYQPKEPFFFCKNKRRLYGHSLKNTPVRYSSRCMLHVDEYLGKAAGWLDKFHGNKMACLSKIHYVNGYFSTDHRRLPSLEKYHGLWAVAYANYLLIEPSTPPLQKAVSLRVLLHVVADLHQPLHTASEVSSQYPEGDKGGNLFSLAANPVAPNLHSYWDRGGGLLVFTPRPSEAQIKALAEKFLEHYQCSLSNVSEPFVWAKESYQLARNNAYDSSLHTRISAVYQQQVQKISEQRLVLAGCRLAALLEHLN